MRLLTRYVLREISGIFLVTLIALTILMILIGAVQKAIAEGLGLPQIVQLLPYLLPNALMFAAPGTILFAVSIVYGRMSGSNEIIALKSMGLSPMVVLWPALALATVLSFATVWLNDLAMSWGFHGAQRVVIDSLEDIAYGMLRANKSFSSSTFSATVRAVEGRKLISPSFMLASDAGPVNIWADTAELRSSPGAGKLTLELFNATVEAPGLRGEYPNETLEYEIVVDSKAANKDSPPAHLSLAQIPGRRAKQLELIEQLQERMVAQAGFSMLTGDFEELAGGGWNASADRLQQERYRLYRMQTEPPRRWANGFSCLCFALVGSAMAIRMRNSDVLTSFALCFFPILLVYYPFLFFGVDRAKAGEITPYAVWLANVVVAVWGVWLLRRVIRY